MPWLINQAYPTTFKEDWKGQSLINSINTKKNQSLKVRTSASKLLLDLCLERIL